MLLSRQGYSLSIWDLLQDDEPCRCLEYMEKFVQLSSYSLIILSTFLQVARGNLG